MENLHAIQLKILLKLLYNPSLRYSQMKPSKSIGNNLFQFHLNHIIKKGFVEKIGSKYQLTKEGKKFAIRIDSDTAKLEPQAKLGVAIGCVRKSNGKEQVLIYTRLKHAYYGCQGFPAGKVKQGETILNAAERELEEETKLIGKAKIAGIFHYHVFNKSGKELLDDLILFLCRFDNPKSKLKGCNEGKYEWVDADKISEFIDKPFQSKKMFLKEVDVLLKNSVNPEFIEKSYLDKTNF